MKHSELKNAEPAWIAADSECPESDKEFESGLELQQHLIKDHNNGKEKVDEYEHITASLTRYFKPKVKKVKWRR